MASKHSNLQYISSPYNFVPLNEKIHYPEWQNVCHDRPLQDGLSGIIKYRLIADSPLLVGKHQEPAEPASEDTLGEVKPFQLPNNRYAIPGSSLKGMIRSLVEIITYGRLRQFDDRRFGFRFIGEIKRQVRGDDGQSIKVKTGFLTLQSDGSAKIKPCSMVRLPYREIEDYLNKSEYNIQWDKYETVKKKYQKWNELCRQEEIQFCKSGKEATQLGQGKLRGFPVFTGHVDGKKKDFMFFETKQDKAKEPIPVSRDDWQDFLFIHGDKEEKADMPWPSYWRKRYWEGKKVPVFYVQDKDKNRLYIGLAYMLKIAGDFSTKDIIAHVNPEHIQCPGGSHLYDMADLIFGALNDHSDQSDALKGRVSFQTAVAIDQPQTKKQGPTILNGPKPSYFPNYIQQKTSGDFDEKLATEQYATYIKTKHCPKPKARGFKRYPARHQVKLAELDSTQEDNKKVQVELYPLPQGTRFEGRIVFHNLKPVELGALIWALTWGGDSRLRHGLGMGKPFGFGQCHFEIDDDYELIPNDPEQTPRNLEAYRNEFVDYMKQSILGWQDRLNYLMAMADPNAAKELPKGMELHYMKVTEYGKVKNKKHGGLVLADYVKASRWKNTL